LVEKKGKRKKEKTENKMSKRDKNIIFD